MVEVDLRELGAWRTLALTPPVVTGPEAAESTDRGILFTADAQCAGVALYGFVVAAKNDSLCLSADAEMISRVGFDRLADLYRGVLASAADPDADASVVHLSFADRQAVLGEWSSGGHFERPPATVLDLFRAQVRKTPDAPAVRCADGILSYRELDQRSDRIGASLARGGAAQGRPIGVSLRRCADLLSTLLGVWKAGAPYLPLDVSLPESRLLRMVARAECRQVVTHPEYVPRWKASPGLDVLLPAALESGETRSLAPITSLRPEDVAYVMYTSGSTGQPKGVLVHHAGLANYVRWTAEEYASRGSGGSPFFGSIGFDLGIPSLFTPLVVGQAVHLLPEPLDPADLGELLVAGSPYSFIKLTPGHLNLLSLDLEPEEASTLASLIVVAGDVFTSELAQRWMELSGADGTALVNEYGPTEITVGNSVQPVGDFHSGKVIPIGRPIPNTTMYVLDVGGDGVSYGYLGDPVLTASRFAPDPYGEPGSRLYLTGDRARWNDFGDVEFLGRADHQMKIGGYRIESAEVEVALRRLPGVADAAVAAVGERPRLTAFLVASPGAALGQRQVRSQLSHELPEYMIPSQIVIVDALPLTSNGKIDKRALHA